MDTDHSHDPKEIAKRLSKADSPSHLKDMVYGGIDGAVTTFSIVAGVQGAGLSHGVILVLGAANILADGFSMAAGNYAGTKAELEDRQRIIATERRHLETYPEGEREELRQLLRMRGLDGEILEQATTAIAGNRERWLDMMLTDEYGLPKIVPSPWRSALATFAAFLVAGAVPLFAFFAGLSNPFAVSIIATLVTFFVIGAAKSRWSLKPWWQSGLQTLLIGAVAAIIAYLVGSLFS